MHHLRIAAALATLYAPVIGVDAQTTPPGPDADAPVEELRAWDTYTVEPGGRYTRDTDSVTLIRNEKGVHEHGQASFSYSDSRETLDVLEAYTETPDGRSIPVPPDRILTKESPASAQAPMFADIKLKFIIFPDVEVHSKLHYKVRLTVKEPLFPGYFNLRDYVFPNSLDDDDKMTVYAAQGVTFGTDVVGYEGGSIACPPDEAGHKCYAWTAHNAVYVAPEPGSVAATDYAQHVIIGNFPSYEAMGKAYWDRAAKMVEATPDIRTLADQLTQGVNDSRAQAEALYNWVARNIRYVAVSVGAGGVVPHPAEMVLQNRYGDCKDHVTLLQALLAAKHIDSVGVLVGANERWRQSSIPDFDFNHIITYIPSLNLYVDSTSQFSRFGQLPEVEVGKMGLKTQPVRGAKDLAAITSVPSEGHLTTTVSVQVNADGSATGSASVQPIGSVELGMRNFFARVPPGQEELLTQQLLSAFGESGSGTFAKGDPRDLTKPFAYQSTFSIPGLITLPGPGAFRVPTGLRIAPVADLARAAPMPRRQNAWACGIPGVRAETTHLTLPESMHIIAAPKNIQVKNGFGSYDAHYEVAGSLVTVTREFVHITTHQPCDDSDYQQFRELTQAIERDARAQILFQ